MKRYTKRLPDGQAVMDCQSCPESWMGKSGERCTALYCRNRLKDRVAAYEDKGFDPEDILSATDMEKVAYALHELNQYKELGDINRIRELVEADRDGRCVVLPCKIGENVWRIYDDCEFPGVCGTKRMCRGCEYRNLFVEEQAFCLSMLSQNGKLGHPYYTSIEAAEAALKGETNGTT